MSGSDDSGRSTPSWRPSNTGPRIGRIGAWGSTPSSGAPSGNSRFATLSSLAGGSGQPPVRSGPRHGSDDEDDEDEGGEGETWFAGGERSGVSIQGPDRPSTMPGGDLVRDLLRRAAEGGTARPPADAPASSGAFSGGGHTLGGEGTESAYIPDPSAAGTNAETESAIRHLTFWRDGFTVEDGDLMRYDDPNNAQILDEINSGRAPPSILNVQAGQHVELRVTKRTEEAYVPSPKKLAAFSGAGNRLGSPVPGAAEAASSSSSRAMPGTFPISGNIVASTAPAVERESLSTRFEVDQTQPTTSIQIRLADGTRMVCRMNLTHIVRDIRNFINASRPENSSRPYNIMTTFPNRVLEDETQTIEKAGLINSVVVQRWV